MSEHDDFRSHQQHRNIVGQFVTRQIATKADQKKNSELKCWLVSRKEFLVPDFGADVSSSVFEDPFWSRRVHIDSFDCLVESVDSDSQKVPAADPFDTVSSDPFNAVITSFASSDVRKKRPLSLRSSVSSSGSTSARPLARRIKICDQEPSLDSQIFTGVQLELQSRVDNMDLSENYAVQTSIYNATNLTTGYRNNDNNNDVVTHDNAITTKYINNVTTENNATYINKSLSNSASNYFPGDIISLLSASSWRGNKTNKTNVPACAQEQNSELTPARLGNKSDLPSRRRCQSESESPDELVRENKFENDDKESDDVGRINDAFIEGVGFKCDAAACMAREHKCETAVSAIYLERVCEEIVNTERSYVKDIMEVFEGYYMKLRDIMPQIDILELFGNIQDILKLNRLFLVNLELGRSDAQHIATCFLLRSPDLLSTYANYCTNYFKSIETLRRWLNEPTLSNLLLECQQQLCHSLPLGAYLLKPVQRILKYHLMLENLSKCRHLSNGAYDVIKMAASRMMSVAKEINEASKKGEEVLRLVVVAGKVLDRDGSKLNRCGRLILESKFKFGTKTYRHLLLYENSFIIAKLKDGGMIKMMHEIECDNLMLVESVAKSPLLFSLYKYDNPSVQFLVQANSKQQKELWCFEIKKRIVEVFSRKNSLTENAKRLIHIFTHNTVNDDDEEKNFPEYLKSEPAARLRISQSIDSFADWISKNSTEIDRNIVPPFHGSASNCSVDKRLLGDVENLFKKNITSRNVGDLLNQTAAAAVADRIKDERDESAIENSARSNTAVLSTRFAANSDDDSDSRPYDDDDRAQGRRLRDEIRCDADGSQRERGRVESCALSIDDREFEARLSRFCTPPRFLLLDPRCREFGSESTEDEQDADGPYCGTPSAGQIEYSRRERRADNWSSTADFDWVGSKNAPDYLRRVEGRFEVRSKSITENMAVRCGPDVKSSDPCRDAGLTNIAPKRSESFHGSPFRCAIKPAPRQHRPLPVKSVKSSVDALKNALVNWKLKLGIRSKSQEARAQHRVGHRTALAAGDAEEAGGHQIVPQLRRRASSRPKCVDKTNADNSYDYDFRATASSPADDPVGDVSWRDKRDTLGLDGKKIEELLAPYPELDPDRRKRHKIAMDDDWAASSTAPPSPSFRNLRRRPNTKSEFSIDPKQKREFPLDYFVIGSNIRDLSDVCRTDSNKLATNFESVSGRLSLFRTIHQRSTDIFTAGKKTDKITDKISEKIRLNSDDAKLNKIKESFTNRFSFIKKCDNKRRQIIPNSCSAQCFNASGVKGLLFIDESDQDN